MFRFVTILVVSAPLLLGSLSATMAAPTLEETADFLERIITSAASDYYPQTLTNIADQQVPNDDRASWVFVSADISEDGDDIFIELRRNWVSEITSEEAIRIPLSRVEVNYLYPWEQYIDSQTETFVEGISFECRTVACLERWSDGSKREGRSWTFLAIPDRTAQIRIVDALQHLQTFVTPKSDPF